MSTVGRSQRRLPADPTAGFDFTLHMRRLCADFASRLPELAHVEMDRVAIRFCQTRRPVAHGMQASLTPLRFANGSSTTVRRGATWAVQQVFDAEGREMLYLLSFYLPRFLDLPWLEKLATTVHELWHIGPDFDGDLRRFPGRCYAHGPSEERFHANQRRIVERWLAADPPAELHDFLRYDFRELQHRHGPIHGTRIATPKLYRVRRNHDAA
jgi:predicted metallopeptidase